MCPVLGAFHVSTASTASGSGLTPCRSTILPRYLIESLRISHFDGFAFQACSFHTSEDLIESINVILQGWCRYGLRHPRSTSRDSRTFWSLLSKPEPSAFERLLLHCTSRRASSSTGTTPIRTRILFSPCPFFRRGTCQKAEPKSNVVKNFASPKFG